MRLKTLTLVLLSPFLSFAFQPSFSSTRSRHHQIAYKKPSSSVLTLGPNHRTTTSLQSTKSGDRGRIRNKISSLKSLVKQPTNLSRMAATALAISVLSLKATAASAASSISWSTPASPTSSWQLWILPLALLTQLLPTLSTLLQTSAVWYAAKLASSPVITKSVTAAVIGFVGDYMAQYFEYRMRNKTNNFKLDWRRGFSIALDGIAISGPLMHYGYNAFEHFFPTTGKNSIAAAIVHVLADSVVLDSIFVATTFIVTGIVEGYRGREIKDQMKTDYIPTLKASWAASLLVFPVELACFSFLPLTFRVLAVNFIDVLWDAVISFMTHRGRKHKVYA